MLARVEERGHLTEKQREIIVRKAEAMGEDMDEVIFRLEAIPSAVDFVTKPQESAKLGKVEKCPHCGSPVTDTMLACPECGYVFNEENDASRQARDEIAKLEDKLMRAAAHSNIITDLMGLRAREQASIINSFTLPATKEGLSQLLEYSYSRYLSVAEDTLSNKDMLKKAWMGKMTQAYNVLARLGKGDPEIEQTLERYSPIIKKKRLSAQFLTLFFCAILLLLLGFVISRGIKSDNSALDRVETCIQNHDYQGAKSAAMKYSGDSTKLIDEISSQEVVYLLSQGEILQAKAVAASINNEVKRKEMQQAIADAENQ